MSGPLARARRLLRATRGTAALEFALVSVPLMLLVIGTIDFGRTLFAENALSHAADTGARLILLDGTAADGAVEAAIRNDFTGGPADALEVTLGIAVDGTQQFRTIGLSYRIDLLTPFIAHDGVTLTHDRRVPIG